MRAVVLDPPTAGLDELLQRRRRSGLDRLDEVLPFYAAHHVDEVLIVDPEKRSVDWLGLAGDEHRPLERSGLIDLGPATAQARIAYRGPNPQPTGHGM